MRRETKSVEAKKRELAGKSAKLKREKKAAASSRITRRYVLSRRISVRRVKKGKVYMARERARLVLAGGDRQRGERERKKALMKT